MVSNYHAYLYVYVFYGILSSSILDVKNADSNLYTTKYIFNFSKPCIILYLQVFDILK